MVLVLRKTKEIKDKVRKTMTIFSRNILSFKIINTFSLKTSEVEKFQISLKPFLTVITTFIVHYLAINPTILADYKIIDLPSKLICKFDDDDMGCLKGVVVPI